MNISVKIILLPQIQLKTSKTFSVFDQFFQYIMQELDKRKTTQLNIYFL